MASKTHLPLLVASIASLAATDAMAAEVYRGSHHPWSASDVEGLLLHLTFFGGYVWLTFKTHYDLLAFGVLATALGAHTAASRKSGVGTIGLALPVIGKVSVRGAAGFAVIAAGLLIILYVFVKGSPPGP